MSALEQSTTKRCTVTYDVLQLVLYRQLVKLAMNVF